MVHRRGFFEKLGAAVWMADPAGAQANQARDLVRAGAIGRIVFCRASNPQWLRFAYAVCAEDALVTELNRADSGSDAAAVFIGTNATLVVDRKGCRLLP